MPPELLFRELPLVRQAGVHDLATDAVPPRLRAQDRRRLGALRGGVVADHLVGEPAEAARTAGADAVVGSHAHRVQGSGWQGNTFVAYGLGNFIWDFGHGANGDTGMLTITIDGNRAAKRGDRDKTGPVVTAHQWTPMRIGAHGLPVAAVDAEQTRLTEETALADVCSGLSSDPVS